MFWRENSLNVARECETDSSKAVDLQTQYLVISILFRAILYDMLYQADADSDQDLQENPTLGKKGPYAKIYCVG